MIDEAEGDAASDDPFPFFFSDSPAQICSAEYSVAVTGNFSPAAYNMTDSDTAVGSSDATSETDTDDITSDGDDHNWHCFRPAGVVLPTPWARDGADSRPG